MRHEQPRAAAVAGRLERALAGAARASGIAVTVERHRIHPWASATFVGSRHELVLRAAPSPALDVWIVSLAEAELGLRGHVVASLAIEASEVDGTDLLLTLAALTIEDA